MSCIRCDLLLCTATNTTPHERFFSFSRRSCSGESLPSWLTQGRKAYLRRFVRTSKNDPLVHEVELVMVNPSYACVRFPGGREVIVNVRDLAPRPQESSMPCQDCGHIRNADTPPRNEGDIYASRGNSSHTDPSPQVVPNVENTPDSPSRDTSLPDSAEAEMNIADDERHVALRRSVRSNKGLPPRASDRGGNSGYRPNLQKIVKEIRRVFVFLFLGGARFCLRQEQ